MADGNSIPKGWVLETETKRDGTQVKYYLCPATGQHFFTYEDLMRYVNYAKAAKVSIYAPDFGASKTSYGGEAKKKGQSSKSLAANQGEGNTEQSSVKMKNKSSSLPAAPAKSSSSKGKRKNQK